MAKSTPSSTKPSALDPIGLANLAVVYVVWSSTYLAIRIAVREGSGLPPFTMGFAHAAFAAVALLLWGYFHREHLRPTRAEWLTLAFSGLLLWTGGNGMVTLAEQRANSGLAALMVAASPIWAAVIEAFIDRKPPSRHLAIALVAGFAGIALLTEPRLLSGLRSDTLSVAALIVAPISWAGGSVLQARRRVTLSSRTSAAYQMGFGSLGFLAIIVLVHEPFPTPTVEAWAAWIYLGLAGSLFAFTSFVAALKLLPTAVVMTYAYVNPVLAVLLGVFILSESFTIWSLAGTVCVLFGVAGVFRARRLEANMPEKPGDA